MADLEQRVATLESEVVALKTKLDAIDRILPDLIGTGFKQMDSRFAGMMAEMERRFDVVDRRFDATLRAIAEMIAKRRS